MMPTQRLVHFRGFPFLLVAMFLLSACSTVYQDDAFIFTAPSGFTTKQYKTQAVTPNEDSAQLIFSQKGPLYFQVFRQRIAKESDLNTVFNAHKIQSAGLSSHYQFISQNKIEVENRPAIEYVFREFRGEPYEQIREIWLENNGWAYALICTDPADSTPGMLIPVSEQCIRLVEGFKFK
jgi:hypothetical protein